MWKYTYNVGKEAHFSSQRGQTARLIEDMLYVYDADGYPQTSLEMVEHITSALYLLNTHIN